MMFFFTIYGTTASVLQYNIRTNCKIRYKWLDSIRTMQSKKYPLKKARKAKYKSKSSVLTVTEN